MATKTAKTVEEKTISMPTQPKVVESVRMNGPKLNDFIQWMREVLETKPKTFELAVTMLQQAVIQDIGVTKPTTEK
jgi:hypothetical protein